MDDQETEAASCPPLESTPLEDALHGQWYGTDTERPMAPWQQAREEARRRLDAFAASTGAEPPTELETWLAEMPAEWMIRYLIMLRATGNAGIAGRRCGFSPYLVQQSAKAHPVFAEAITRAREAFVDTFESALAVSATVGDPEPVFDRGVQCGWKRRKSEKAAVALLEKERPAQWRKAETSIQIANVLPDAAAVGDALRRLAEVQTIALNPVPQTETPPAK